MNETGSDGGLTRRVRSATRWVAAAQLASQIVSLTVLAALFRLVAQADFGLMGMAVPLVFLWRSLASAGLSVAAVQQRRLSAAQTTSLFWLQMLVGTAVAAATVACGPLVAWAYRTPQASVVCAALAGTTVFAACGASHQALLERELRLGRLATVRLLAQIAGGSCGVAAACAGWGVWSLIVQQYVELIVLNAGLWLAEPFRPRLPWRGAWIGALVRFSGWHTLSSVLFAVAHQADKILLAVLLGATGPGRAVLGMYTQAYQLMTKPVFLVSTPLTGLMLPALSRARAHPETFRNLLASFYRMVGIALLPCGFGLFVVAEDLMLLLGGPAWQIAGTFLQALAPAILVLGSINVAGSVLSSVGEAKRLAVGALGITIAVVAGVGAGSFLASRLGAESHFTAIGIAWGLSLTLAIFVFPAYMYFCAKTVDAALSHFVGSQLRALLAAAAMGLLVWVLQRWGLAHLNLPVALRLVLLVAAGVVSYVALAWGEICWLWRELLADPIDGLG